MKSEKERSVKTSDSLFYRVIWWVAVSTIVVTVLMIYSRILQITPAIQCLFEHKKNEMPLIVGYAALRQFLRMVCVLCGLIQIIFCWHLLFLRPEQFQKQRKSNEILSTILTLVSWALQYAALTDLFTNIIMGACLFFQSFLTFLILRRSPVRLLLTLALLIYAIYMISVMIYGYTYCHNQELPTTQEGVSTVDASDLDIAKQIWSMSTENEFYHAAFYEQKQGTRYGLIPLPGLTYADSVTGGLDSHKETCTSMTPQGIAVSDNFIFVSAYCHTSQHNSLIFILDRETGSYIKEIVLPEKSHVGGLAYDPNYGTLWIATSMKKETDEGTKTISALACITDDDIANYSFVDTEEPIAYRNVCPTQFKSNSCLEYKDGAIYIAYWMKSKMAMSIAGRFEIRKSGVSVKEQASEIMHIPGQVQGISIDDDQIYFAVSYGLNKSAILAYDYDASAKTKVFSALSPKKSVDMPQMLEEIALYDGMLYTLFESSAFAYRHTAAVRVDHIVKIRTSVFR
jgi:hypothetical protein